MNPVLERDRASAAEDSRLSRDLHAMVGDGAAFSVMVGLGETYFSAFALAAGLGAAVSVWMATLPVLAGGLVQLVTPFMVMQLRSCRTWVLLCASLQAASFLPLIAAGLLGHVSAPLLFLCATCYWGFGMSTGPAWNVWAESLVPGARRARFFASRSRWCQAALLAAVLGAWILLHHSGTGNAGLKTFALLFALASAARVISTCCLAVQRESSQLVAGLRPQTPWRAWRNLRGSDAERLLLYLLALQTAVNLAAPLFTPFMLGPLGLSHDEYTLLIAVALAARIAVLPMLGRLAQARSNRSVLWLGAVGISPLPAMWLVSESFPYLIALQCMAGASWAAFELSTLLAFFEDFAPTERASVLSAFNLASAAAMSLGGLIGGLSLHVLGASPATYALLFLVSSAGRFASLGMLRRIAMPKEPLESAPLRTLAVRPSFGAVQGPILAALPQHGPPAASEPEHDSPQLLH